MTMTFWDFYREYLRQPGAIDGPRGLELLKRVGVGGPAGRPPCRVCGVDSCSKPGCFKALLAEEEALAFRQRLAEHAAAAQRDATTHRNGDSPR
jgi:hypothetical protein